MAPRPAPVLALAFALLLVACAAPPPAPPPPPPPPPVKGRLTLANVSGKVVFRVRFAPASQSHWGPDRLDEAEVIEAGGRRTWDVPIGNYKLVVEFGDGSTLEAQQGYEVAADEETVCSLLPEDADRTRGALTLENATPFAITRVYLSPVTDMTWGEDRLGPGEVLPPKKRRSWTVPQGRYNVRVEFQDGVAHSSASPLEVQPGREAIYRLDELD